MVSIAVIAKTELVRMLRERSNLFFVFVFPLLLVVLIGASFGEGAMETRVGVVYDEGDEAAARVVERLDAPADVRAVTLADEDELHDRVSQGTIAVGVSIPQGFGADLERGESVDVGFVARQDAGNMGLRTVVEAAVDAESALSEAALSAAEVTGLPLDDLRSVAGRVGQVVPGVEVVATEVGQDELAQEFAGLGQFDLGASSQLFLFTFLTALSGGAALIQTRQLGIARRMMATATPVRDIIAGQAGGRILVALTQAVYIVVATLLLFRVDWGDPLATGTVVVLFCVLSGAAGMLLGSVASNDSQAAGLGVGAGLGLAALGGSMAPIEIFPETMRTIAHLTPHAWANRAMAEIVRRDGGLSDVLLEIGVLAGFAVALLGLATWRLRRVVIR